mgnify:CR=1 FL=1
MKFKIGDKVILNGYIYVSSNATTPSKKITNKVTNITRIAKGTRHPYNTTGDLGWCDETSLKLYGEEKKYEGELTLIDLNGLVDYVKEHDDKVIVLDSKQLKSLLR